MKIKVLLVDDEKKFVVMLAKRLALRGIDVDYVHDGEAAMAKVGAAAYDVVVLDVKMPGMSGIELKRAIAEVAPGIKVIFLTGHGSQVDFETAVAEGATYLAKPFQIEVLVEKLHAITGTTPA